MTNTVSIFLYSQTGNSYICAKKAYDFFMKNNYKAEIHLINNCSGGNAFQSDLFVFVFPIYIFNIPAPVRDFVKKMPKTENKKALAIITYGGTAGYPSYFLEKALKRKGIKLINSLLLGFEDNYIPFRRYLKSLTKPNMKEDLLTSKTENFLSNQTSKKANRFFKFLVFFKPLYWLARLIPSWCPKYLLGRKIFDKSKCTLCGICYKLCATNAIINQNNEIIYNDKKCIGCCGCVNSCPTHAWTAKKYEPKYYYKSEFFPDFANLFR